MPPQAYDERPDIIDACCADVQAVYDRDPACDKYTQALLYFKGFQVRLPAGSGMAFACMAVVQADVTPEPADPHLALPGAGLLPTRMAAWPLV